MAQKLAAGAVFAHDYRVVQPLSQGGMGAVYVVEQTSTGARRALKLMLPHLASDDDARARFEREAKVGARIASDHVVQVLAAGVDEATGSPFLVMELLEGESLEERLGRDGPLSHQAARALFAQLGHAMGAAHDAGIVHRDLKPENLHVGKGRREGELLTLKVLDFGIAKLTLEAGSTSTAPIGTLAWMAPEQADEKGKITPATDVWSIGLIAFWSLIGAPYWKAASKGGSAAGLVKELLLDALPLASARAKELGASGLPIAFDDWFSRCVVRSPSQRFQDGGEACKELVRLLDGSSATADKTAIVDAASVLRANAAASTPMAPKKRPRALPFIAGLGMLVAASAVAWRFWPRESVSEEGSAFAPASQSASVAKPVPTAITDLPPPKCQSPKVLELYQSALQDFRDANWDHARSRLKEAVAIEPTCSAAEMRLATTEDGEEARASYQRAVEHRSDLSPRDRGMLDAIDPAVRQTDRGAAAHKALLLAEAFPGDAELWGNACTLERDEKAAAASCRKSLALDPDYADIWQGLAVILGKLHQRDKQMQALDRCIELSSTSVDCRRDRSNLRWDVGRCDDALSDLRDAISLSPKAVDLRETWVLRLTSRNRPYETLLEAFQAKWALVEKDKQYVEALDRFQLAWATGRYSEADGQRAALDKLVQRPDASHDMVATIVRAEAGFLADLGRYREAAELGNALLRRADAWAEATSGDGDNVIGFSRFQFDGYRWRDGLMTREQYGEKRRLFVDRGKKHGPDRWLRWQFAYDCSVDSVEAEAALANRPDDKPPPQQRTAVAVCEAFAGRGADALSTLQKASSCDSEEKWLALPVAVAFESTGQVKEACKRFNEIIDLAGKDKLVPVFVKRARERVAALHCKPASP